MKKEEKDLNKDQNNGKELKHIKIYEQFFDDEEGGVATAYVTDTEDFMVMESNSEADYSAVFTNEDGELTTIELARSQEPITEEGIGRMGVIEGTSSDGREYEATGKYEKTEDEILGDLWSLKSISIETV